MRSSGIGIHRPFPRQRLGISTLTSQYIYIYIFDVMKYVKPEMSFIDCIVRSHFNYLANDDIFFFPVGDVRRGIYRRAKFRSWLGEIAFFFGSHCQKV